MGSASTPRVSEAARARVAWLGRNPLKKWRTENGVTQSATAGTLGYALRTVASWEVGDFAPRSDALTLIAKLIGDDPEGFEERWNRWMQRRPTP